MNIATILTLLQMVVSLLTNSQVMDNPTLRTQALNFANQSIVIATEALKQPAETPLGTATAPAPIVGNTITLTVPVGTEIPPTSTITTPTIIAPSCTLTATQMNINDPDYNTQANFNTIITWTTKDLPETITNGTLYVSNKQVGGNPIYSSGPALKPLNGTMRSVMYSGYYKAMFGNVVCYAQ